MRENILNGKWFIRFNEDGNGIASFGQILGEVSDGWFFVGIMSAGMSIASRQVVPVAEFENARFYISETEMITVRRSFDKPLLKRTGETNES